MKWNVLCWKEPQQSLFEGGALYVTWHLAHCVWNPYCELAQNATYNHGACVSDTSLCAYMMSQLHAFNIIELEA